MHYPRLLVLHAHCYRLMLRFFHLLGNGPFDTRRTFGALDDDEAVRHGLNRHTFRVSDSEHCKLFREMTEALIRRRVPIMAATVEDLLEFREKLREEVVKRHSDKAKPHFPEGWQEAMSAE